MYIIQTYHCNTISTSYVRMHCGRAGGLYRAAANEFATATVWILLLQIDPDHPADLSEPPSKVFS